MSTATRTVMFSDLAGFTAHTNGANREELLQLIAEHERLVTSVITARGGRVVNRMGDGLLLCFDSATEAGWAGREILERARAEASFELRLSAATGDVEEVGDDVLGDVVNLAARLNKEAHAGECLFTDTTRQCMNQREIPWEPLDPLTLRGLPAPVAVIRVVPQHKCHLPGALVSAQRSNNLIRTRPNEPGGLVSADPVVLLEGFEPGSEALQRAIDTSPALDPGRLWMLAYQISPAARQDWLNRGHRLLIGTPEALDQALDTVACQDSTFPVAPPTQSFGELGDSLTLAGLALPAVPLAHIIAAYTYDLLSDPRWLPRHEHAVLRVTVRPEGLSVTALCPWVTLNGRELAIGETQPLFHDAVIAAPGSEHRLRSLQDGPYRALLVSTFPQRLMVSLVEPAELGRDPQLRGYSIPERRAADNIVWCPGPRAARAREDGFTLNRSLVSRRHAQVSLDATGRVRLQSLTDRCGTYVVSPRRGLTRVTSSATLADDDLIVLGTHLIGVTRGAAAQAVNVAV